MKVWVLSLCERYEGGEVIGVFSTEARARAKAAEKPFDLVTTWRYYELVEVEVDGICCRYVEVTE